MLLSEMVWRSSALASRKLRRLSDWSSYPLERARRLPSASMSALMSLMMILETWSLLTVVQWSSILKAISPVPPAMSRIVCPCCCACPCPFSWEMFLMPGCRDLTKWSFQRRCVPRDIRSFMVS